MQEFVMLVGPSGCGKSTWAKSYSKNYNYQYVIFLLTQFVMNFGAMKMTSRILQRFLRFFINV